jgi:hypothetical protein
MDSWVCFDCDQFNLKMTRNFSKSSNLSEMAVEAKA